MRMEEGARRRGGRDLASKNVFFTLNAIFNQSSDVFLSPSQLKNSDKDEWTERALGCVTEREREFVDRRECMEHGALC